jgi:UDP-N-acetylmuramoyl-tripeptide--D-alanyl-D-alanine ligase
MSALWTSAEAEAATGGRATRPFAASGVSIDSRSIAPGDLFVALSAQRDGHDFVADALARGASAAMVARVPPGVAADAPLLIVPEVLAALTALGAAGRARSGARVIAVTGSVGKTSTKEMLRTVLAGQGRVHAAEASFNNHWGVPLTLARLPREADFAVVEIGMNHPGEIAPLAILTRPHAIMITTIAAAHLEAFGSLEKIAVEKASICAGLAPGGLAVLPEGLAQTPILIARAHIARARIVTFGDAPRADWRIEALRPAPGATVAEARTPGGGILFKVMTPARHFAQNALGVLALVAGLGLDPALAVADLARWQPPRGRGNRLRVLLDPVDERQSFDLIDDAYNANPASMAAALEVLAQSAPRDGLGRIARGRRIAVLGDMLELGPEAAALHRAIADLPALGVIDTVHCAGPLMAALWQALPEGRRGEWAEDAAGLAARAHHLIDAGDVVLVKGSKGSRVSAVAEALARLGEARAADGPTGGE